MRAALVIHDEVQEGVFAEAFADGRWSARTVAVPQAGGDRWRNVRPGQAPVDASAAGLEAIGCWTIRIRQPGRGATPGGWPGFGHHRVGCRATIRAGCRLGSNSDGENGVHRPKTVVRSHRPINVCAVSLQTAASTASNDEPPVRHPCRPRSAVNSRRVWVSPTAPSSKRKLRLPQRQLKSSGRSHRSACHKSTLRIVFSAVNDSRDDCTDHR